MDKMTNGFFSGLENAPKRALLRSSGITQSDLSRPLIGIVYSQNDTVSGHSSTAQLLKYIQEGVISAGGRPVAASVMSVCSGVAAGQAGRFLLPSRELIADSTEMLILSSGFDAVVFVGCNDSTVPAFLLAAARVNLPCIFVSPGTSAPGYFKGEKCGMSAVFEGVYGAKSGKIAAYDIDKLEQAACSGPGSGAEMSTSNTMCCLTEALGLALPGNGTALFGSGNRLALARRSGEHIVAALQKQILPKQILTVDAFINAARFLFATGGSLDAVMHLTALAYALNLNVGKHFSYDVLQSLSDSTPSLCKLAPASAFFIDDFDRAGGVMATLCSLAAAGLLKKDCLTVTGDTVYALCADCDSQNTAVIALPDAPVAKKGAVGFLYGNIADDGALIRRLFVSAKEQVFTGPARVFESEEEALYALTSGGIPAGSVIVVRNEGPKGSPGMREMRALSSAICGMGLENKVALVTDGRVGGIAKGWVVGHVCPEAAAGGAIAALESGDIITIDLQKGRLTADLPAKTVNQRLKKFRPRTVAVNNYLQRYSRLADSSRNGAVLHNE